MIVMVMMVMIVMVMVMMMVRMYIYLNHCQPVIVAAKLKLKKISISRRDCCFQRETAENYVF